MGELGPLEFCCMIIRKRIEHTLEAFNVRDSTFVVWSCAATSSSVFGRLFSIRHISLNDVRETTVTYYFSTHGWSCSSLGSVGFCLELLDAAAAAARALLLKKLAAIAASI